MPREGDIRFEQDGVFVISSQRGNRKVYNVCISQICSAQVDSSYDYTESGLFIAMCRAKYLVKELSRYREQQSIPKNRPLSFPLRFASGGQ